jgi:hypothetical protein
LKPAVQQKFQSSPINGTASATPSARILHAKAPKSMPARPQRSALLQSNKDGWPRVNTKVKNSPQFLSQQLKGGDSSEDELVSTTPRRTTTTAQKESTPGSRKNASPKVVISPRPKAKTETVGIDDNITPAEIVQSPVPVKKQGRGLGRKFKNSAVEADSEGQSSIPKQKRGRGPGRKSKILIPEVDNEGEFLIPIPVDDPADDSDFTPLQLLSSEPPAEGVSSRSMLESKLGTTPELIGASRRQRRSDQELQSDGALITRTTFEPDSPSFQLSGAISKPKIERRGRSRKVPQVVHEMDLATVTVEMYTCAACDVKEPRNEKSVSDNECNACADNHVLQPKSKKGSPRTPTNGNGGRPTRGRARIEGPLTSVNMKMVQISPAQTTPAVPRKQSPIGRGAVSTRKKGTRTVLFSPQVEVISHPGDEEGVED